MKPLVLRRVVLGLLVVGVAIQLYRPARTNPAADPAMSLTAAAAIPPEAAAILKRACYDCHSNETRWPWYSNVAPVSWGVIGDVSEARGHFNFSEWGSYSPARRATLLEKICEEVREGGMPLASYLLVHWDARLSDGDRKAICAWADAAGRQ
jgi:hypothetical protein